MRRLSQRYKSDCFPTCVAMVTGVTHTNALRIVHPKHIRGQSYGTSYKIATRALVKLKLRPVRRRVGSNFKLSSLKKVCILSIRWKKIHNRCQHAVVWDPNKRRILDPAFKRSLPLSLYQRNAISVIVLNGLP